MSPESPFSHPQAEHGLRELLTQAGKLYDQAGCGYHAVDASGGFLEVNDTLLHWLGLRREELVDKRQFRDLVRSTSLVEFDRQCARFSTSGVVRNLELELSCAGGRSMVVLVSVTAVRDAEGRFHYGQALLVDISARHRAERLAQRTVRALRVLSAVNAELVNAGQEKEFLDAVCRMVVVGGGYQLAAVSYAQSEPVCCVRITAQASVDPDLHCLDSIDRRWGENGDDRGPACEAMRSGTAQIRQHILTDPQMAPWHEAAAKAGIQSSIALPIGTGPRMIGVLEIWAPEPDAFETDEVQLLLELANNLAFGIHTVRARVELLHAQEMIARLAYHDSLTGLANRTRLLIRLREAIQQATTIRPLALMTVVIERFDAILAGIGVRPADLLLAQVAERLTARFGGNALVARTGTKRFAALLPETTPADAREIARQLQEAMQPSFVLADIPIGVEVSIGVALAPTHTDDPETLLLHSELAARAAAGNADACAIYSGSTLADRRWLALLGDLRIALEQQQLQLFFQPKVNVRTGSVAGAEALLRWTHPLRGVVPPSAFMQIAEQTGLITPLTDYVVDGVLRQLRQWADQGFTLPVAVNVSVRNFSDVGFVDRLIASLARHGVDPALLQLELTESTLMEEPSQTHRQLLRLQGHGVTTSIDDFGTGYSSLSYIANLPVASLKIDRSFVSRMNESERVRGIVAATISMAEALSLTTIAEGVENRAQADALIALGCDELQGYWFSRPVAADELRAWVQGFRPEDFGLGPSMVALP